MKKLELLGYLVATALIIGLMLIGGYHALATSQDYQNEINGNF